MTGKILSYLKQLLSLLPQKLNRRRYLAVFGGFLVIGLLISASPAAAVVGYIASSILDGFLMFFTWLMLILAQLCIGLTIFFLRFFISIAAYNNYIDVAVVQLGWIMIRDVANMFFVVALLVIAFGTILGIEEYEWKKNLVKLILAAILINFSNLIAQLIIDIAHVFTITFLNAVAATAGGNIINMFKLDQITQMVGVAGKDPGDFRVELAAGALAATGFAVLAAVAMGSYAYVMMVRVVVLWGLIILAPGAYILGVLPKTKSYADRWWSEFGKHVVVAPVMVFFLWLSFATLGNGQIAQDIQKEYDDDSPYALTDKTQKEYGYSGVEEYSAPKLSLAKVTTWESMASFFIAMAFMYYGLKVTQETGATGAGAVGAALEFGKKVATIATGYAAGRWLVDGATNVSKKVAMAGVKGVGWGLYHAPGLDASGRVQRGKEYFQMQWQSFEAWRNRSEGPTMKRQWNEEQGRYEGIKEMEKVAKTDKEGNVLKNEDGTIQYKEKMEDGKVLKNEDGTVQYEMRDTGRFETEDIKLGFFQKMAHKTVVKNAESAKKLEKTQKFAETRKEYLSKTTKGVPTGVFMKDFEQVDALDRYERGRLKAAGERSAAKTEEHETAGALAEGSQARFQSIVRKGWFRDKIDTVYKIETLDEEIAGHKVRADSLKKRREENTERAKKGAMAGKGKGAVEARMRAELSIKALQGETKQIEEAARFRMATQDVEIAKETNATIERLRDDLRLKNSTLNKADAEAMAVGRLRDTEKMTDDDVTKYVAEGSNPTIDKLRDELMIANSTLSEKDAEKAVLATTAQYQDELMKADPTLSKKDAQKQAEALWRANGSITAAQADEYRSRGEGAGVVYRAAQAEKQAHTEAERLEELTGAQAEKYAESHHGLAEIKEEAELGKKIEKHKDRVKELEDDAVGLLLTHGTADGKEAARLAAEERDKAKIPAQIKAEKELKEASEAFLVIEGTRKKKIDEAKEKITTENKTETETRQKAVEDAQKRLEDVRDSSEYAAFTREDDYKKNQLKVKEKSKELEEAEAEGKSEAVKDVIKKEIVDARKNMVFSGEAEAESAITVAQTALDDHMGGMRKAFIAASNAIREGREGDDGFKVAEAKVKTAETVLKTANEEASKDGGYEARVEQHEAVAQSIERAAVEKSVGLGYIVQKQASAKAKAGAEEAEKDIQNQALGLVFMRNMMGEEQARKLGAEAAEKFIEGIKKDEVAKIFTKGAEAWKKAVEKGKSSLKDLRIEFETKEPGMDKIGAKLALAEVVADYSSDIATVKKKEVADEAEDAVTLEKYGYKTPSSAFNDWVKKRMEAFQGVEREQAVQMAFGSLSSLVRITETGGTLTKDQEAQMMANVKYLTSQAWSDDLLARIGAVIEKGESGELIGKQREEAESIKKIFIDRLRWGKMDENGKVTTFKNRSGFDRTNALHRLSAYGGNIDLTQSENAVLKFSKGNGVGYVAAAEKLAKKVEDNKELATAMAKMSGLVAEGKKSSDPKMVDELVKIGKIADSLGMVAESIKDEAEDSEKKLLVATELMAFARTFVGVGDQKKREEITKTATEKKQSVPEQVRDNYTKEIRRYEQANEMLTDFKTMVLKNGHLDDGGHTIFDMDAGFAHGQLDEDAIRFVLSDWRKMGLDQRLAVLKSHTISYMDENDGTADLSPELREVMRETFQGLERELSWKRQDGRVVDHLAQLAAGEKAQIDRVTGEMVLGSNDSVRVKSLITKGSNAIDARDKALTDIANNILLAMDSNPDALLVALANRSGKGFDFGKSGQVNVRIESNKKDPDGGVHITSAPQLFAWAEKHAEGDVKRQVKATQAQIKRYFDAQAAALKGGKKGKKEEDEDTD